MIKTKLKVGDEVIVISGKSQGQRGKILALDKKGGRIIAQGVNMKKRFARPSQENPKGGILEAEFPIHISNVMYYDSKSKSGTRIKMGINKAGKKIRMAVKGDREID